MFFFSKKNHRIRWEFSLLASFSIMIALAGAVRAEEVPISSELESFQRTYIYLEGLRNYPAVFSEDQFDPGLPTWLVGYRHLLLNNWMMGVGGSFKSLLNEKTGNYLPILTVNHQADYIVRLYHPTYLLGGPRLLYMVPASRMGLPLQRDPEYRSEIGVGIGATLFHIVAPQWAIHLRVERWRGTVTGIFHGTEVAAGVDFGLSGKR